MKRIFALAAALLVALLLVPVAAGAATKIKTSAANIKHVFVIVLENKNYSDTFSISNDPNTASLQDPYLQKTLVPMGALLTNYYGTGHVSLDNYLSLVSGQAPTASTADDCLPGFSGLLGNFDNVQTSGRVADPNKQVIATGGCVYPKSVKTIADQLNAKGLSWKAYMEDMGNDPARESATCGHPAIGTATDNTNSAEAPSAAVPLGDAYATRHNPFVYFHSIIDSPSCKTHVVNFNQFATDIASTTTTPNFTFITPNLCNDGHDGDGTGNPGKGCANGQPGGLTSVDAFLHSVVPQILNSPAYKQDGLLVITFDESNLAQQITPGNGTTTPTVVNIVAAGTTCCQQQPGPNLAGARPGTFNLLTSPSLVENLVFNGYGGDRIGALLLSPFVKAHSQSGTPYNHYSLLRTIEDIFGVPGLGYAANNPKMTDATTNAPINYAPGIIANDTQVFK